MYIYNTILNWIPIDDRALETCSHTVADKVAVMKTIARGLSVWDMENMTYEIIEIEIPFKLLSIYSAHNWCMENE